MDKQDILAQIGKLHQINRANVKLIEVMLKNMNMIFIELQAIEDKIKSDKIITSLN